VAKTLEGPARELFNNKNFAHLSTTRADGTVQSVVVWVDVDDNGRVLVNTSEGRTWPENVRRNGNATLSVANQENPYEFAAVTGRLVEDTHEGADEHIDHLAHKYMGVDSYPYRQEGEQRVKLTFEPQRVNYASAG
jgi:PPOX class probable F420-dependent enzyme